MKTFLSSGFNRFVAWLCRVLDTTDTQSSTRLVLILSWTCVLAVWCALSLPAGHMQEIPASVLALLGMATGAKTTQNYFETKAETENGAPR